MRSEQDWIAGAAEWRLIALLLERPRDGWHEEVAHLAREVRSEDVRVAAAAASAASEGVYLDIFGPGGFVSPRVVAYRPFADPGQMLAELAAQAGAFGFRPGREEPLDHVAVLSSFVSYLLVKEAFARAGGDAEAAEVTAVVRQRIIEDMLAPLAAPCAARLQLTTIDYLRLAAEALAKRVPAPPPGPLVMPDYDPDEGCDGCGGLP